MDRFEPSQQPERASYRLFSPPAGETDDSARKRAWKGDSFSFRDVLDIVNPLQHLPVVSTLYRWLSGDTIGAVPRMIGDAIYGGPIGFLAGLANAEVKQESGKDVGEQVIAMLGGDTATPVADPQPVAAKDASPSGTAAPPVVAAAGAPAAAAGRVVPSATAAAPPAAAAPTPADPSGAFLAHQGTLHRQLAADSGALPGRALSNKVVPLQGIGVPPGLLRTGATAAPSRARPLGTDAAAAPPALPTNPPIDISQQMMEALDKYTRLQQQRDTKADAGRGAQLDLMQ